MLSSIEVWLSGKKTYIISIMGVMTMLVQFFAGDVTFMQFIGSSDMQALLAWAGLGTMRAAIAKPTAVSSIEKPINVAK